MDQDDQRDRPGDGGAIPVEQIFDRVEHLLAVGQLARAREMVAALVAGDPEDPDSHLLLARVALASGDPDAALDAADRARRLEPDDAGAHALRGSALFLSGRFAEAEQAYLDAIRLEPEEAVYHEQYARLLSACDRDPRALEATERALRLDPDDPDLHALRARLLLIVSPELWHISEESARRALALDASDADAHAVLGHVLLGAGGRREAEQAFRAALEIDPSNQLAIAGLSRVVMAEVVFYRPFLAFAGFMQRQTLGMRAAIVIGLWLIVNGVDSVVSSDSAFAPAMRAIFVVYIGFCLYTWFAAPITRWILRRRYPWLVAHE